MEAIQPVDDTSRLNQEYPGYAIKIQFDLWILDALLTNKDPRDGRGDENKIIDLEDFLNGELYYLSDGGYSRIFYYNIDDPGLRLATESTDRVRELWYNSHAVSTVKRRLNKICWELYSKYE